MYDIRRLDSNNNHGGNFVSRILFLILVSLIISSCCNGWHKSDKTLLYINGVLMTADMLQTQNIYDRSEEGYYEYNPVINWGVGKMGKAFVPLYFGSAFALQWKICDMFPAVRTKLLATSSLGSAMLVIHNQDIGLRFSF